MCCVQVSGGAEVISLNKKYFVRNATAEVQQRVHLLTQLYPSPVEVLSAATTALWPGG